MKFTILKKKRFYAILIASLLLLLYIFMNLMVSFSSSNEDTLAKYEEAGVPLRIKEANLNGISYQYLEIAKDSSENKPILLLRTRFLSHPSPNTYPKTHWPILHQERSR